MSVSSQVLAICNHGSLLYCSSRTKGSIRLCGKLICHEIFMTRCTWSWILVPVVSKKFRGLSICADKTPAKTALPIKFLWLLEQQSFVRMKHDSEQFWWIQFRYNEANGNKIYLIISMSFMFDCAIVLHISWTREPWLQRPSWEKVERVSPFEQCACPPCFQSLYWEIIHWSIEQLTLHCGRKKIVMGAMAACAMVNHAALRG